MQDPCETMLSLQCGLLKGGGGGASFWGVYGAHTVHMHT